MENNGIHIKLTGDSSSYVAAINACKSTLKDFAAQSDSLKERQKEIRQQLAAAKKEFGRNSEQVKKLKNDLTENANAQKKLAGNIKDVNEKLEKAQQEFGKYGKAARKNFDDVKSAANDTFGSIKNGINMLKGLMVGYAGKKLYEALIGTNAEYEQSKTSFEVLLQSAEKADALMSRLENMGAVTPFETSDLTKATTQLLAFGTAEDDIEKRLQQLGDLSMGQADKLDRLTNAYGKMLAKGKVSLEELNMFTEAGVPILSELQKQLELTQEELFSYITDGKIGINEINAAMAGMTNEGGRFFGMMEKQSQTMEGMLSTASDNVTMFARKVGEESFEYLKIKFADLLAQIDEMSENGQLDSAAKEIGADIASLISFTAEAIEFIYKYRDGFIALGLGIGSAKLAYSAVTGAISLYNTVSEISNVLSGKAYVCKNLETGATVVLTAAEKEEAETKGLMITAQTGFNAVCDKNVYVALAAAILSAVAVVTTYIVKTKSATKVTEEFNARTKVLNSTEVTQAEQLRVSKDRLYELENQLKSGTLTEQEATAAKKEMNSIVSALNSEIPNLKLAIDGETGTLNRQRGEVDALTNSYYKLAYAKAMSAAYESKINETARQLADEKSNNKKYAKDFKKAEKLASNDTDPASLGDFVYDLTLGWLSDKKQTELGLQLGLESDRVADAAKNKLDDSNNKIKKLESDMKGYITDLQKYQATIADETERVGEKTPTKTSTYAPTSSGGSSSRSSGGSSGQSSSSAEKNNFADEFKKDRNKSLDWISDRNLRGDWEIDPQTGEQDSEVKARQRLIAKAVDARNKNIIDADYFEEILREDQNKIYSLGVDAFKAYLDDAMEYIEDSDHYGDWGTLADGTQDSFFKAARRLQENIQSARNVGQIDWETGFKAYAQVEELIAEKTSELVKNESEQRKRAYEDEFNEKKKWIEKGLEQRKREIEKESEYLDKLVEKRKQAKEDEDYNTRMQRLKLKLEYENDETNRIAIQKEIDKLQEEIDDTAFDRDISKRKAELADDEEYETKKAEKKIDKLSAYYKEKMTDINIAQEILHGLDPNDFKTLGKVIGSGVMSGLKESLSEMVGKVVSNITENLSQIGGNVTNNTKNINISQNNTTALSGPEIVKATLKALETAAFFEG